MTKGNAVLFDKNFIFFTGIPCNGKINPHAFHLFMLVVDVILLILNILSLHLIHPEHVY